MIIYAIIVVTLSGGVPAERFVSVVHYDTMQECQEVAKAKTVRDPSSTNTCAAFKEMK